MAAMASVLHLDMHNQRRQRECQAFAAKLEDGIPIRATIANAV